MTSRKKEQKRRLKFGNKDQQRIYRICVFAWLILGSFVYGTKQAKYVMLMITIKSKNVWEKREKERKTERKRSCDFLFSVATFFFIFSLSVPRSLIATLPNLIRIIIAMCFNRNIFCYGNMLICEKNIQYDLYAHHSDAHTYLHLFRQKYQFEMSH